MNAVFNLSSDAVLMAIALPMFLKSHMAWKKKIPLVGIFGLGFFVMLCAILNKYYSFTQPFGSQWTYWYARESSTSILVANLPFLWTLIRKFYSNMNSQSGGSKYIYGDTNGTALKSRITKHTQTVIDVERGPMEPMGKGPMYDEKALLHSDPPSRDEMDIESPQAAKLREQDMEFLTSPHMMTEGHSTSAAVATSSVQKPTKVSHTFERNLHDFHRVPNLRKKDESVELTELTKPTTLSLEEQHDGMQATPRTQF